MKKLPFRLSSLLLPSAFAIASVAGASNDISNIFILYTILLLISCAGPGSFRNAACAEPGIRRVDARFLGSAIICAVSGLIMVLCAILRISPEICTISCAISAVAILFEQLYEERLYAIGRSIDANLLSVVTSILFLGSALLGNCMIGAIIGCALALLITCFNQPIKYRKPIFSFNYAPRALLQDLLCPAILAVGLKLNLFTSVSAYFGWSFNRLCRTFARCSSDETRMPRFAFSIFIAVSAVLPYVTPQMTPQNTALLIPAFCVSGIISALVCFALEIRTILFVILLTAVLVLFRFGLFPFAVAVSIIMCIASFDRRIFLRKV